MKTLISMLICLFLFSCGKQNATLSKDTIFSQLLARMNQTTQPSVTPADVVSMFGPPDSSGNRTSDNLYYRYNIVEGGFVEIEFTNNFVVAISIPSNV